MSLNSRRISVVPVYPDNFKKQFPIFKKPKVYGYFSLGRERNYTPDISQLKYFHYPALDPETDHYNLDLNKGFEIREPKEDHDEKIDNMLHFIIKNFAVLREGRRSRNKLLQADYVCFRGLLTHMMISLYQDDPWSVLVTNWRGTIYLSEVKQAPIFNSQSERERMERFCSWGYKFEQYTLTDKFNGPPNTEEPVRENEEFCCVFQSKLNNKNLMYGAEMDGVISKTELKEPVPIDDWDNVEFVEVKTNRRLDSYRQQYNLFKYKFIKWWAQCFLVGIKTVYCGYRNDDGIVQKIQKHVVRDLPKQTNQWNPTTCMNLMERFLDIIQETVPPSNNPFITHRVEWKHSNGQYYIETWFWSDDLENSILPNWYTQNIMQMI